MPYEHAAALVVFYFIVYFAVLAIYDAASVEPRIEALDLTVFKQKIFGGVGRIYAEDIVFSAENGIERVFAVALCHLRLGETGAYLLKRVEMSRAGAHYRQALVFVFRADKPIAAVAHDRKHHRKRPSLYLPVIVIDIMETYSVTELMRGSSERMRQEAVLRLSVFTDKRIRTF